MIRRPPRSTLFPYTDALPISPRRQPVSAAPSATNPWSPAVGTPMASVQTSPATSARSEEHTSELQSRQYLVCRLLLEKKKLEDNLFISFSHLSSLCVLLH